MSLLSRAVEEQIEAFFDDINDNNVGHMVYPGYLVLLKGIDSISDVKVMLNNIDINLFLEQFDDVEIDMTLGTIIDFYGRVMIVETLSNHLIKIYFEEDNSITITPTVKIAGRWI